MSALRWRELLAEWNTEFHPAVLNFLRTNPLHMLALRVCIFVYGMARAASTLKLTWDRGGALEFVCPPPLTKNARNKNIVKIAGCV